MEEDTREKTRNVSILQVRSKFLEEENSRLQERIDSILQQKHGLDKLLKEQKLGKEREVIDVIFASNAARDQVDGNARKETVLF